MTIMMMTKFYRIINPQLNSLIAVIIGVIIMAGCSSDFDDITSASSKLVKRELIFTDSRNQTRGLISEFPDNAVLYIRFRAKKSYDWTKATYSASEKKWTVEFPEEIVAFGKGTCDVAYADTGNFTTSDSNLDLDTNTSVMMSEDGEWNAYGSVIVVSAHLKPVFYRIRFVSDSPTEIWAKGFGLPSNYSFWSHSAGISSAPCYPKYINVNIAGEDGKYYSKYFYSHTSKCEYLHTNANIWASDCKYLDCPENLKLSIYYPTDPDNYYYKDIKEFNPGESYVIKLPTNSSNSGWKKDSNITIKISDEIKIGDGSNMSHTFDWKAGDVVYGKSVNFELSSNGGDGYVSISGTNFSYEPIGAYSGKKISAIYDQYYGYGNMTFRFNVSSLKSYYTKFENITISQFPIYTVFETE